MATVTVRLDKKLDLELTRAAKRTGRPKSDLIREALRRQLAVSRFEELRRSAAPFAEARGWLTDEEVSGETSDDGRAFLQWRSWY